ncbi:hypothetical protein LGM58_35865 [Burkholderia contaminans]|uniref:hypothetical protein n=1 Tax=Burkholderia contaminans TaxID=488447 RepID=UPI001CF3DAA3|nr:hypothetical protein [Burkholderia contaminans]MCA7888562.1 hypothetical protein [Burkholderia contaminans]
MKEMKKKILVAALSSLLSVHAFAFDWASKSIQIERQYPDGKWGAYDPISLNESMTVEGRAAREPTVNFRQEPRVIAGEIRLDRKLKVSCNGREIFVAGFAESDAEAPWAVEIHSPCGTWLYTLVDSNKSRRPAQGVGIIPGFAPAAQPHS